MGQYLVKARSLISFCSFVWARLLRARLDTTDTGILDQFSSTSFWILRKARLGIFEY